MVKLNKICENSIILINDSPRKRTTTKQMTGKNILFQFSFSDMIVILPAWHVMLTEEVYFANVVGSIWQTL
jgi:hypothetical protein